MKIDENELAAIVSKVEGGASQVNIANIKEVMKAAFDELAKHPASEVMALIEKHK